ncbi:hypothetical protein [Streptomyces xiaopingdaonensis]|uniref:hypothetical protein n=1 Tax=Streptomyces xiaopingdaonensis TaxID=1565415 RepID=UPI0012FEED0C|nr:hypothetical protein [Streptomyces xiaopingdaonensis]
MRHAIPLLTVPLLLAACTTVDGRGSSPRPEEHRNTPSATSRSVPQRTEGAGVPEASAEVPEHAASTEPPRTDGSNPRQRRAARPRAPAPDRREPAAPPRPAPEAEAEPEAEAPSSPPRPRVSARPSSEIAHLCELGRDGAVGPDVVAACRRHYG